MKRMMGTVLIAGFLVVTADLKAAEKRFDRVKSMDGPKPEVALTNGPQLLAVNDFGSPPPAPAKDGVFQAPANDPAQRHRQTRQCHRPLSHRWSGPAIPRLPLPLPEAAPPGRWSA